MRKGDALLLRPAVQKRNRNETEKNDEEDHTADYSLSFRAARQRSKHLPQMQEMQMIVCKMN